MYDFFLYKGNLKTVLISPKFNLNLFKTVNRIRDWSIQMCESLRLVRLKIRTNQKWPLLYCEAPHQSIHYQILIRIDILTIQLSLLN